MSKLFYLFLLLSVLIKPSFGEIDVEFIYNKRCVFNEGRFWDHNLVQISDAVTVNILDSDGDDSSWMFSYINDLLKNWHYYLAEKTTIQIFNNLLEERTRTKVFFGQYHTNVVILWTKLIKELFTASKLVPDSQAVYVFFVLQPHSEFCIHDNDDIDDLLKMFWDKYSILNLLVVKPCSCDSQHVYNYDPFTYNFPNKSWGIVRNQTFEKLSELKQIVNSLKLGGYPLNVSLFTRMPTAVRNLPISMSHYDCHTMESDGFLGLDGCVLANMAHYMNFSVVLVGPTDTSNYGYRLPNGSFVGSLGDVVNKRVHISANSRFINVFDASYTEFTSPVNNDLVCLVVPKAKQVPKWMVIFHCFNLETWLVLLVVILGCGVLWHLMQQIEFDVKFFIERNLISSILDILRVFLSTSLPRVSTLTHRRLLITSCMIFNVIITGIFQGTLFTSFSSVSYYPDIDTLEDLYASKLPIATSLDIFQAEDQDQDIMKKLRQRTTFLEAKALNQAAVRRNVAAVERMEDAKFYIQTKYLGHNGLPMLHIVAECPSSYFLAYIVPRNSPFLSRFNVIITKFREAGLIGKWYYEIVDGLILNQKIHAIDDDDEYKDLNISDLQTPFYLLFIGIFISLISFIVELIF